MSMPVVDGVGHAPQGSAAAGSWPSAAPAKAASASRLVPARRRRNVPYLLVGALLVVTCAVAAVVTAGRLGDRESVLALASPVAAGQVLAIGDVRTVEVAAGAELDLVPAGAAPGVVGRPVAFSLPAGTLLTRAAIGPAQVPAAGQAVAAVGLKPGQFPPGIEPGAKVAVLVSAGSGAGAGTVPAGTSWTGVVVAVHGSAGEQTAVVSVRMAEADARAVAAAPAGQLSVVMLGGER